jgi:hypothetical protein
MPKQGYDGTSPKNFFIAIVLTVLLHFVTWQAVPEQFGAGLILQADPLQVPHVAVASSHPDPIPEDMLPEEMRTPKPPPPRFVEVNPEAPSNNPPDARNTGAATQRAAQPNPTGNTRESMPKMDGEEPDSTRIVNNIPRDLLPPQLQPEAHRPLGKPNPSSAENTSVTAKTETAKESEGPLPVQDLPRLVPVTKEGIAVSMTPGTAPLSPKTPDDKGIEPVREPSEKKLEGVPEGTAEKNSTDAPKVAVQDAAKKGQEDGVPDPQPRPQAVKVGTTGIKMRNAVGTNEAGTLALDAKYSEFGDYAQRMIEIIQSNWWFIIERTKLREGYDKKVIVEFTLCKDGTLKDVEIVYSTASSAGAYACKDAIESRAPFDPWREDMVLMLGDEERGRFTFYYR